jgi:hypothetical protein
MQRKSRERTKTKQQEKYKEYGGVRRECYYYERQDKTTQTRYVIHSRLEKLAVSSPLPADVDQDHVGIVRHVLLPVRRREGHHVGGKQIVVGSGDTTFLAENGEEGCCHHRTSCELPPKAFAGAADAQADAAEEESHSLFVVVVSPRL